jgi:hypothetical protein
MFPYILIGGELTECFGVDRDEDQDEPFAPGKRRKRLTKKSLETTL